MSKFKKMYLSLMSLFFVSIIFGTATFAWISMATINSIDGLSITASTGEELQISLDGENFSNTLDIQEMEAIFQNITLIDITSMDGIHFQTGGLRGVEPGVANEHYVSFDLWFRTSSQQDAIFLVNNVNHLVTYDATMQGTYVVSRGVSWRARETFRNGPDMIVEQGTTAMYYASNAIRIAVIERVDNLNPNDQRPEDELIRFLYDPSENPERGYGSPYGAFDYFNILKNNMLTLPTVFPDTSYRLTKGLPSNPYQAEDNESMVLRLVETGEFDERDRPVKQGKVTVNIWLEGWDADAFDSVERDRVKIQLQFRALHPASD
ncbi:MAG: hypothetical protein EA375_06200 [Acholeplasmataceae bacterium]|nr:MAG: hypothetical protein EA375_06200 [Acholeplasmataceae bacterium]